MESKRNGNGIALKSQRNGNEIAKESTKMILMIMSVYALVYSKKFSSSEFSGQPNLSLPPDHILPFDKARTKRTTCDFNLNNFPAL